MAPDQLAPKKTRLSLLESLRDPSFQCPSLDARYVLHALLRLDLLDLLVEPLFQLLWEVHYPVDEAEELENIVSCVALLIEPAH